MKLLVVHDHERVLWAEILPELTVQQCRKFKMEMERLHLLSSVEEVEGNEDFEGWQEGEGKAAREAAEQRRLDFNRPRDKPGQI